MTFSAAFVNETFASLFWLLIYFATSHASRQGDGGQGYYLSRPADKECALGPSPWNGRSPYAEGLLVARDAFHIRLDRGGENDYKDSALSLAFASRGVSSSNGRGGNRDEDAFRSTQLPTPLGRRIWVSGSEDEEFIDFQVRVSVFRESCFARSRSLLLIRAIWHHNNKLVLGESKRAIQFLCMRRWQWATSKIVLTHFWNFVLSFRSQRQFFVTVVKKLGREIGSRSWRKERSISLISLETARNKKSGKRDDKKTAKTGRPN